jgi:hypothetical protein
MVKASAVVLTSGTNCGQSAASLSRIRTAVTIWVFVPAMTWALTQSRPERFAPYFSSYHRVNRLVLDPVESGANVVSTAAKGREVKPISSWRTGVKSGLSRNAHVMPGCIV